MKKQVLFSVIFTLVMVAAKAQSLDQSLMLKISDTTIALNNAVQTKGNAQLDLSIEQLTKLHVVKNMVVENQTNLGYALSQEELSMLPLHLTKSNNTTFYELETKGHFDMQVFDQNDQSDNLRIDYDLSKEGTLTLTVLAHN
jgi:hypothetical protein